MPRKRMIDPGIWDSEQVMSLGSEQFKLYVFLISQADDEGRLKNTPKIFRSRVHPIDDYPQEKFDQDFEAIIKCGLVKVYGGGLFLFHPNWRLYQKIDRPTPSHLPDPEQLDEDSTRTRRGLVPNRIEVNRKEYIAREKTEVAPDVFMAEDERAKLVAEYGEATTSAKINELSCALGNRIPKNKYKDHYKTVKNWIERDKQKAPPEPTKRTVKHKLCGSCGKEYFGSACTCGWSE